MADVRMVHHNGGYKAMRSAPGGVAMLEALANRVAAHAAAGGGKFAVGSRQGVARPKGRWRTSVVTADYKARRRNAKEHVLQQAVASVR